MLSKLLGNFDLFTVGLILHSTDITTQEKKLIGYETIEVLLLFKRIWKKK